MNMTTTKESVWKIPTPLKREGRRAAKIIRDYCQTHDLGSSERMFYSPKEWTERGEEYGTESLLVIVHEGCDASIAISLDGAYNSGAFPSYRHYNELDKALRDEGLYLEGLYSWCSAVYKA
jgi:hypothetical protein